MISEDIRNELTDDVIVVPVFSRGAPGPTRVTLPAGSGGLTRESTLFCEEITTIDRDFLRRGPLGPPIDDRILEQTCHRRARPGALTPAGSGSIHEPLEEPQPGPAIAVDVHQLPIDRS